MQWFYKPRKLFLKQEQAFLILPSQIPSPPLWSRKLCLEAMTDPRPVFHSSCMQCSHWSHLIQLTSADCPCTECATQNLRESIIPQLTLPWHLQPPIYFRLVVYFSFPPPSSLTKRSISFLSSQTTLNRGLALPLENSDYHFAL